MSMDRPPSQNDITTFRQAFSALQGGNEPFPWQERLFREFVTGRLPAALDLPTGLGKTSVMAIWLIARALADDDARNNLPRRLVYVVDRRAVVDQATAEAEKIREGLGQSGLDLERLGLGKGGLPISTLRGQHVDNRNWLADPTVSAIIVGTADMIGSRLLFSGYGVSRKMRPFHAGLLGVDTLVVLDEAHLVPPFDAVLRAIAHDHRSFGARSDEDRHLIPAFRLLSLSATGKNHSEDGTIFQLDGDDKRHPIVAKRLDATKKLTVHDTFEGKVSLVDELADRARDLGSGEKPARVLVYCHSRADALRVRAEIEKRVKKAEIKVQLLIGQRRVHERDELSGWLDKNGFTGGSNEVPPEKPTFLIATAAGEVGIDLNADHMVCDLVEWERMVQRLGRVNRRGEKQSQVEVIALPSKESGKGEETWQQRLELLCAPLDLLPPSLEQGVRDASPGAILMLKASPEAVIKMRKAETDEPLRPALNRALVDAWSMTSLEEYAGRPDVEPWLRGWLDGEGPQCAVVWREHLPVRMQAGRVVPVAKDEINEFFEAAPPHLSEMLEGETWRIAEWLFSRIKALTAAIEKREKAGEAGPLGKHSPVLFMLNAKDELDTDKGRRGQWTIDELAALDRKERERDKKAFVEGLGTRMLIVSKHFGGLKDGMLDDAEDSNPVAMDTDENWVTRPFRLRETSDPKPTANSGWKQSYRFACNVGADEDATHWFVVEEHRAGADSEESRAISGRAQTLIDHRQAVMDSALGFAKAVGLPEDHVGVLALAALLHDEGKDSWRWQRAFNAPRDAVYAKTKGPVNLKLLDGYRHEFGSLVRIEGNAEFQRLPHDLQDLLLHLVAAHHGNARPLISKRNADDTGRALENRALEVTLRFERLQRRWGPWGLAWWESLLRAADQKASRENDEGSEVRSGSAETGEAA
jgi:CRISPR-associated endonuclease/helicase Cas3